MSIAFLLSTTKDKDFIINSLKEEEDNHFLFINLCNNPYFYEEYENSLHTVFEKKTNDFFIWKNDLNRRRILDLIIENGIAFNKKRLIRFLNLYNKEGSIFRNPIFEPSLLLNLNLKPLTKKTYKWLISVFINYQELPSEFISIYFELFKSLEVEDYWKNEDLIKLLYTLMARHKNTNSDILKALSEMSSPDILEALELRKIDYS